MTSDARPAAHKRQPKPLSDSQDILGYIVRKKRGAAAPPTSATEVASTSLFERALARDHDVKGDVA